MDTYGNEYCYKHAHMGMEFCYKHTHSEFVGVGVHEWVHTGIIFIMWLHIIIHTVIRIATYTIVVYGVALVSI